MAHAGVLLFMLSAAPWVYFAVQLMMLKSIFIRKLQFLNRQLSTNLPVSDMEVWEVDINTAFEEVTVNENDFINPAYRSNDFYGSVIRSYYTVRDKQLLYMVIGFAFNGLGFIVMMACAGFFSTSK